MTALACLKVFVGDALRFGDSEEMADLVGKVAGAYLESTWLWPRRHGLVAPYSFVLADPRATALDARELQALSRDLQQKLFGDKGDGEITLLMFEGDQAEIMRFAGLAASQLASILAGKDDGSLAGRVCKITPTEVISIVPEGGPVVGEPPLEVLADEPFVEEPARVAYRGVYHTGRQTFVGNVAVWRQAVTSTYGFDAPKPDGDVPEHDIFTLEGALNAAATMDSGMLFFPISFSSIIKPSTRALLLPHLEALPKRRRGQLAAAVYDTPRAPTFWALSQLKTLLEPYFSRLDLRVTDPAFQIDDLPSGLASSVTLALPKASEAVRLAAINRFMKEAPAYRRHQVWQGIGDVTGKRELNVCIDAGAPFLTGPAISELLSRPTGGVSCSALHLPLHDWSLKQESHFTPA